MSVVVGVGTGSVGAVGSSVNFHIVADASIWTRRKVANAASDDYGHITVRTVIVRQVSVAWICTIRRTHQMRNDGQKLLSRVDVTIVRFQACL